MKRAPFRLIRVRSPLLAESRCFPFLRVLRCFSSPTGLHPAYTFSGGCPGITPGGLPHSDIHGSKPAGGSPWLFAANHVLLRPSVPRHPPRALASSAHRSLGTLPPAGPTFSIFPCDRARRLDLLLQRLHSHAAVVMPCSTTLSLSRCGTGPRTCRRAPIHGLNQRATTSSRRRKNGPTSVGPSGHAGGRETRYAIGCSNVRMGKSPLKSARLHHRADCQYTDEGLLAARTEWSRGDSNP